LKQENSVFQIFQNIGILTFSPPPPQLPTSRVHQLSDSLTPVAFSRYPLILLAPRLSSAVILALSGLCCGVSVSIGARGVDIDYKYRLMNNW